MIRFAFACILILLATAAAAPAHAAKPTTVPRALAALERADRIDDDAHDRYLRIWKRARRAVRRLDGAPSLNLDETLDAASSLARDDRLGPRLHPVFLTIERNYDWFWRQRRVAAGYGARTTFTGSRVIFQFYPGSGWQIQPLANFGRLNGLARDDDTDPSTLAAYARELLSLAVERRGFLAFEHYFTWSGGEPGWISGMSTATGVQALSRVTARTGDSTFSTAAESMLPAFFRRPPVGVKLTRGNGRVHYLQYSQSPRLLVGNAFAQTLIGLEEFTRTTGSRRGRLALRRGVNQAERALHLYDTGAWSLYWRRPGTSLGAESTLHYHELFTTFLGRMCRQLEQQTFCDMRERFVRYESEPVRITHLRAAVRDDVVRVRWTASKPGRARVTLRREGRVVSDLTMSTWRGSQLLQARHAGEGRYEVRVDATSLNGIRSSASEQLELHPENPKK